MTTPTARFASLSGLLPSENKLRLVNKFGKHVPHRKGKGDED